MAEVILSIGDRRHTVACRDGEEGTAKRLGEMLDARWPAAARASGGAGAERTMLFVALMLADSLVEAESRPASGTGASDETLAHIAEQLEALATALEETPPG